MRGLPELDCGNVAEGCVRPRSKTPAFLSHIISRRSNLDTFTR